MNTFLESKPQTESIWRSVILFGRNVASYKFALGKSLLELADKETNFVSMEDLAEPFSRHISEHLKINDNQGTSQSSRFLNKARDYNKGDCSKSDLLSTTVSLGFNNVIDAFHIVHDGEIGVRFFTDERKGSEKGIRLTQDLFRLTEQFQYRNLPTEVEARWRLVETAWELKLPRHVLTVDYDAESELLVMNDRMLKRKAITGCRDALNGYQKGMCFYCFSHISVESTSDDLPDVDHFFAHTLKPHGLGCSIDGVWNLVLACQNCNRGSKGKFTQLPELKFLERLHRRNNFFIESHHPLRETLIYQTGANELARRHFLQTTYNMSKELLIQNWKPEHEHEPAF